MRSCSPGQSAPAHRAPGRIPGSSPARQHASPGGAPGSACGRSGRFRLPGDPRPRRRAVPSGRDVGRAPAAAGGAAGRAPAAAPGAGRRTWASVSPWPSSTWSRCCRTGPSCIRCGWRSSWSPRRASRSPGAATGRSGSASSSGRARVAYDQLGFGFAPFPLGPAIAVYTIFDRARPGLALDHLPAGGGGHRGLGGLARPSPAVRHHLPGDDLRSPPRRRACSAGPSGPASRPRRAGPTGPRPSSTASPRRPPSGSGSGSPASCTTSWPTTSA